MRKRKEPQLYGSFSLIDHRLRLQKQAPILIFEVIFFGNFRLHEGKGELRYFESDSYSDSRAVSEVLFSQF